MLKSESLIQLINSLTKQEKKEFSIYISNKPEKDYIFLFRLIDDKKISDPEELKQCFLKAQPTSSFSCYLPVRSADRDIDGVTDRAG